MATATPDSGMNWAFRLMGGALVLALGFVAVKTVITFTNPESAWSSPKLAPTSPSNVAISSVQNYSFTTDPFNREVTPAPEFIAEVGQDAPETTLNLKLKGRTTAKASGTVVILTPDNKMGNYRVGDEIVSGVTLQAVNKDFVVLDVDGQMQRLTFERSGATGLVKKTGETDEAAKTVLSIKVPAGESPENLQSPAISQDVSQLFQNVSLRRVMKDGHLTGYSVRANRPGVDLISLGFSKGDIITNVGGTDLTIGRPDFMALFEQADKNGGIDITVLRNGQIKTIRLGTP